MKVVQSWILALLCVMSVGAEIKLSALFSDGMVLQRNKPIAIWGQVDPNTKISLRLVVSCGKQMQMRMEGLRFN